MIFIQDFSIRSLLLFWLIFLRISGVWSVSLSIPWRRIARSAMLMTTTWRLLSTRRILWRKDNIKTMAAVAYSSSDLLVRPGITWGSVMMINFTASIATFLAKMQKLWAITCSLLSITLSKKSSKERAPSFVVVKCLTTLTCLLAILEKSTRMISATDCSSVTVLSF